MSKEIDFQQQLYQTFASALGLDAAEFGAVSGSDADFWAKHDKARHGGHFDPETMTCKLREAYAEGEKLENLRDEMDDIDLEDTPEDTGASSGEPPKMGISRIFTGTSADYSKPSLMKVGTGEGSQVYGWGLYGSEQKGVAETYADVAVGKNSGMGYMKNGEPIQVFGDSIENKVAGALALWGDVETAIEEMKGAHNGEDIIRELKEHGHEYREYHPQPIIYEQTFFTDRAPGDESHLLKWYDAISDANWDRVIAQAEKEGLREKLKGAWWFRFNGDLEHFITDIGNSGDAIYEMLSKLLGGPQSASEFLARAGIDGVKYPVDSYGGKGVKDGDKAGWNYVSFRDDNIRIDKKYVDGQKVFDYQELMAKKFPGVDALEVLSRISKMGNPEAMAAEFQKILSTGTIAEDTAAREVFDALCGILGIVQDDINPSDPDFWAKHDKARHGGHFDPETMTCKLREAYKAGEKIENLKDEMDDLGMEAPDVEVEEEKSSDTIVTPEEDAAYMEAVEKGDMETAERMVREAAAKAGYKTAAWHGTELDYMNNGEPWTVFDDLSHFGTKSQAEMVSLSKAQQTGGGKPYVFSVFLNLQNPKRVDDVPSEWGDTHSEYWYTEAKKAFDEGYDSIVYDNKYENKRGGNGDCYLPFHPSQIKSADPVTYDDEKNVIPLSRRFADGDDIRGDVKWKEKEEQPSKKGISRIFTGSVADYSQPSLTKLGTGQGTQVYGYGLYGSTLRNDAEYYAALAQGNFVPRPGERGDQVIYEQTFFTNRDAGDESHLLSWYEPVSDENKNRIDNALEKISGNKMDWSDVHSGEDLYRKLANFASPQEASEFLANNADIDGIKYPAEDHHGRQVGTAKGWNYVSFRDDNIRIDKKYVDGQKIFDFQELMSKKFPNVDPIAVLNRLSKLGNKEAMAAEFQRILSSGNITEDEAAARLVVDALCDVMGISTARAEVPHGTPRSDVVSMAKDMPPERGANRIETFSKLLSQKAQGLNPQAVLEKLRRLPTKGAMQEALKKMLVSGKVAEDSSVATQTTSDELVDAFMQALGMDKDNATPDWDKHCERYHKNGFNEKTTCKYIAKAQEGLMSTHAQFLEAKEWFQKEAHVLVAHIDSKDNLEQFGLFPKAINIFSMGQPLSPIEFEQAVVSVCEECQRLREKYKTEDFGFDALYPYNLLGQHIAGLSTNDRRLGFGYMSVCDARHFLEFERTTDLRVYKWIVRHELGHTFSSIKMSNELEKVLSYLVNTYGKQTVVSKFSFLNPEALAYFGDYSKIAEHNSAREEMLAEIFALYTDILYKDYMLPTALADFCQRLLTTHHFTQPKEILTMDSAEKNKLKVDLPTYIPGACELPLMHNIPYPRTPLHAIDFFEGKWVKFKTVEERVAFETEQDKRIDAIDLADVTQKYQQTLPKVFAHLKARQKRCLNVPEGGMKGKGSGQIRHSSSRYMQGVKRTIALLDLQQLLSERGVAIRAPELVAMLQKAKNKDEQMEKLESVLGTKRVGMP